LTVSGDITIHFKDSGKYTAEIGFKHSCDVWHRTSRLMKVDCSARSALPQSPPVFAITYYDSGVKRSDSKYSPVNVVW